jgi:hypothetical protein
MEMSLNTVGSAQRVRPRKTPRKLQLRTNQSKTKYAINFENDSTLLASSVSEVIEYTTLIAESDTVFKGYEYDWKFILNRWIERHKVATGFKNRAGFPFLNFENIPKKEKLHPQRQRVKPHSMLQP